MKNNFFKKAGKGLLALSILANTFMPLGTVYAEGTYTVTINVENTAKYQIAKDNSEGHEKEMILTIAGDSNPRQISITESGGDGEVTLTCPTTAQCIYTVANGRQISIGYNTNDIDLTGTGDDSEVKYSPEHNFNSTITLSIKEPSNDPGNNFDGHAVVIWSCGTGTCYHKFDNIVADPDGITEYKKASTIDDDNDSLKKFDVHAQYKGWALEDKFDAWVEAYKTKNSVSAIDWTQVDASTLVGNPPDMRKWEEDAIADGVCNTTVPRDEFEACVDGYYISKGNLPFVKLQPVGEPNEKNAYVSYGDRNFKIAIYNDDFRGLTLGTLDELEYYPAQWSDPMLRREGYDISGTTKEKPAQMESILLDSTYRFKELAVNNFEVASVEPLDVPEGAVTVSKSGDEFVIGFNSNFYDNVVFKVTDSAENEYYIQVKRFTIDAWFMHDKDGVPFINADFYFNKELSYTNFDITAKIVYKDGTVKNIVLEPYKGLDDGLGNITDEYEELNGKGLKRSTFKYGLSEGEDKKISKIYLNAEYKGSTAETYAGAYVGSGLGTLANIYVEEEA